MIIYSKILSVLILWFIVTGVIWCSTSVDTSIPQQQANTPTQAWSNSAPTNDPLAWLTDTEKQFMQFYIDEWKERLQNMWEWWTSWDTWFQRADRFGIYQVYTSLKPYSNDADRLKILVAVYTEQWAPVQWLQDLPSSGKRWNIIVDGNQYIPYMDAWFFFESEFRSNWNQELTIEFDVNWDLVKQSIELPQ